MKSSPCPPPRGAEIHDLARTTALAFIILSFAVASFSQSTAQSTKAAPTAASAVSVPKGIERVTSVEGITEYKLANGLRVLLFPDPSKPTITVNVTYLVGSRHENYGETGMAHLLEHLVFKGTPRHPNIPQELTAHGARPNGSTWWDRTNYFETFQGTEENFEWALDLEADRMVNSFIAKKDLDTEMTVVRNEFEAGENFPAAVLEDRTVATAYLWHNYGNTTIGARADLENVPIDRLQAFYRTHYQPDNAVLLIAGRIDESNALKLVDKYFSKIPKPSRGPEKTYTAEPTQDGERSITVRRVGDVQLVHAVYHMPPGSHADAAPVDIMVELLGSTPAGRLHKALVETKKAAAVSATHYVLREPGFAIFRAEVRQENSLDDARQALLDAVEGLAVTPPTKEEIDRARTTLLKTMELTLNSADRIGLEMSEWIAAGDWRLFFLHRDRLRQTKDADVARVTSYLKPANRTVGLFIPTPKPDRAEIPAAPDIAATVKDYKGEAGMAAGEAFDASPINIESRTTRLTLGNGMKVALLPKETRGDTVVANLVLRFGDEKSLANRAAAANLAAGMLMRGSSRHTRQQIKDEFDRLKARVNVSGDAMQAVVSIETVRENLPAVLGLLAEILRQPAFPASELEQLRQEELAAIEEQRSDPQALAFISYERRLNPHSKEDPRYTPTADEDAARVKAVRLEDVASYHSGFYGAASAQLAVVGDFDAAVISAAVGAAFGDWSARQPYTRIADPYQKIAAASETILTPDKANAVLIAGMNLELRDDDPDYPALILGNFMLGGGFLNSRLATRIRQKEGISYGVGSQLIARPLDKSGAFMAYAIYAPENSARLEAALEEEIDRVLKDGYTPAEISEAKAGLLQSRKVSRAQDAGLARTLSSYLFLDRTLAWDAEIDKKIEALTAAQILEAMRRQIDPAKISLVKAGDFDKAKAAEGTPKPSAK